MRHPLNPIRLLALAVLDSAIEEMDRPWVEEAEWAMQLWCAAADVDPDAYREACQRTHNLAAWPAELVIRQDAA